MARKTSPKIDKSIKTQNQVVRRFIDGVVVLQKRADELGVSLGDSYAMHFGLYIECSIEAIEHKTPFPYGVRDYLEGYLDMLPTYDARKEIFNALVEHCCEYLPLFLEEALDRYVEGAMLILRISKLFLKEGIADIQGYFKDAQFAIG